MNLLCPDKVSRIFDCYCAGLSIRRTADVVGASRQTVQVYRQLYAQQLADEGRPQPNCQCGRVVGHRGWCTWRYQQSEKRQAFLKGWNRRPLKVVSSEPGPELILALRPARRCGCGGSTQPGREHCAVCITKRIQRGT